MGAITLQAPKNGKVDLFWSPRSKRLTLKVNLFPCLTIKTLGDFTRREGRFSPCPLNPGCCRPQNYNSASLGSHIRSSRTCAPPFPSSLLYLYCLEHFSMIRISCQKFRVYSPSPPLSLPVSLSCLLALTSAHGMKYLYWLMASFAIFRSLHN